MKGVVVAIDSKVASKFSVGDEVYGTSPWPHCGCHADFLCVNADFVLPKPSSLSFVQAASLPMVLLLFPVSVSSLPLCFLPLFSLF